MSSLNKFNTNKIEITPSHPPADITQLTIANISIRNNMLIIIRKNLLLQKKKQNKKPSREEKTKSKRKIHFIKKENDLSSLHHLLLYLVSS